MPKLQKTQYLQYCPLCGSHDLNVIGVFVDESEESVGDTELTANVKCQSCLFELEATANVQEWEFQMPTEIIGMKEKIEPHIERFNPFHKGCNTADKFIYANALQLLAEEALEAAQNNASNAPGRSKRIPTVKGAKPKYQREKTLYTNEETEEVILGLKAVSHFQLTPGRYNAMSEESARKLTDHAKSQGWKWIDNQDMSFWDDSIDIELNQDMYIRFVAEDGMGDD